MKGIFNVVTFADCRLSKLVSLTSKEYLRIAGSAFLVDGVIHCLVRDKSLSAVYEGPCVLPATPALYWCTTDVKVGGLHCQSGALLERHGHVTSPESHTLQIRLVC